MKDIYKNPILYYILVPAIVGLWPLLVWAIYLPAADKNLEDQQDQLREAEAIMMEILTLDPDRSADANDTPAEFTYDRAVERVAGSCGIPPSKHKLNPGMPMTIGGQKSQSANVSLSQIDIVKFARFLWMIQLRWANLQCNRVKLTKKSGLPDMWDVDIEFKYYY
jgi:hypothetical protein